jgi:hypothetical protein
MADQGYGHGPNGGGAGAGLTHWEHQTRLSEDPFDAVDSYFQCITTCSLEDGECVTRGVEQLREVA